MLPTGTPSIVQQRIILVVFLAMIGALVWWQGIAGESDHSVQKFSKTPGSVDGLDFTMAEAAWSELQIDRHGNLKIDALTESALLDAIAVMQKEPSDLAVARMAFLLEKQFGARASHQIMELLPVLKNYKEAEQRLWKQNGNMDSPPHEELVRLQDELLGEALAKKMFSEQRRLADVMMASQRIRNDSSLTPAERERALLDLQQRVENEGARSE